MGGPKFRRSVTISFDQSVIEELDRICASQDGALVRSRLVEAMVMEGLKRRRGQGAAG